MVGNFIIFKLLRIFCINCFVVFVRNFGLFCEFMKNIFIVFVIIL